MGTNNPFDRYLSSQEGGKGPNTFASLQRHIRVAVQQCEADRQAHKEAWEVSKAEHHERRMEAALEREQSENRYIPPRLQAQWDAEDDNRYAYLTHFDQLLELRTHEEYLRGRRAWERRHNPKPTPAPVVVAKPPMTPQRVWGIALAILIGVLDLAALAGGPGGAIIVLFSPILWGLLFVLPLLFTGWNSSRGGRAV
jgi:hypothetical protein